MPNDIQVRIAEIEDIETIAELNTAMAWETEQKQLDPATIRRGIRAVMEDSDYGFYVVAEQNGEVVGCLLITYRMERLAVRACSGGFRACMSSRLPPSRRVHPAPRVRQGAGPAAGRKSAASACTSSNRTRWPSDAYHQIGMQPTTYRMYEETLRCTPKPADPKSEALKSETTPEPEARMTKTLTRTTVGCVSRTISPVGADTHSPAPASHVPQDEWDLSLATGSGRRSAGPEDRSPFADRSSLISSRRRLR